MQKPVTMIEMSLKVRALLDSDWRQSETDPLFNPRLIVGWIVDTHAYSSHLVVSWQNLVS